MQYRRDGRSRRARLGEHGRLTPDQARSMAKSGLGAIEGGSDPVAERKIARSIPTFREVAEDFLKLHAQMKRKDRTAKEYERILTASVFPIIGSKRITAVRRADVASLHGSMSDAPYQANRAVAVISSVWNWGARRDIVKAHENPAANIDKFPEKARQRYLTDEELARLGAALQDFEFEEVGSDGVTLRANSRVIDPYAIFAIRLLIFTGARLQEILQLKWEYFDAERGVLNLPDSKTGRKTIYLSSAAQAVLASVPRTVGNAHVIPGMQAGAPRADLKRPWKALTDAAGLSGLRIHDLRHSFASVGAGASLGLPIVGKLLGHTQAATTNRYAHLDADPMMRAAELVGGKLSVALQGRRERTQKPR